MATVYTELLKKIEKNYQKENKSSSRKHPKVDKKENHTQHIPISIAEVLKEAGRGYSGTGYLISFIDSYLKNNAQISEIIDKIKQTSGQYLQEDIEKAKQKTLEFVPRSKEAVEGYTACIEGLVDAGFHVTESSAQEDKRLYVEAGKDGKCEYKTISSGLKINGLELTKEMFMSQSNPYEASLLEFMKKNPDCEQELQNAQKEYKKLSSNKLLLSISRKRQSALEELGKKVEHLQLVVKQKEKLEEYAAFYGSLTEEQESTLAQYFVGKEKLENLHKEITENKKEVAAKQGYGVTAEVLEKNDAAFVESALETLTPEEKTDLQKFLEETAQNLVMADQSQLESRTKAHGKYNMHRDMVAKYLTSTVAEQAQQKISERDKKDEVEITN